MNPIRAIRTLLNNKKGQSIVEMTIITPLVLVALYIPVDFGVAFFMGNFTQTAAREGARIGSKLQKSGKVPDLVFGSDEANAVKTEVFDRLPASLTNKAVTVTFYTGTDCLEIVEVTAQGDYNFFLYQLVRLMGGDAPNTATISRTTQMYYTFQPLKNQDHCTAGTTYGPYSS